MSEPEIEPYIAAAAWDAEGETWAVQADRTGEAAPMFTVGADGLPDTTAGGGAVGAPLEWGEHEHAAAVQGWQTVTDLDGQGGSVIPGCLQAAYWQGRLWLRLLTTAAAEAADTTADITPAPQGEDGGGCIGTASADGFGTEGASRPTPPALYICPQEARAGFLCPGGAWRTDIHWEVLANYSYTPSAELPGWDIRVTLWVIPVGNVLCFYTTASPRWNKDDTRAAAALRAPHSAFGQLYPQEAPWAEVPGVYPFAAARLPWQTEGAATLPPEAAETRPLPHGTLGQVGTAGDDELPADNPAGWVPRPWFCPRWHMDNNSGMAWEWTFWSGYSSGTRPKAAEFFAARKTKGWEDWCSQAVTAESCMYTEGSAMYETAQADYRFDPWLVEGAGMGFEGFTAGMYACGADLWPPVATDYVVTARAELQAPLGKLYLVLAGAAADGTLLTASAFAEPYDWTYDPDNPPTPPDPPPWVPPTPPPPEPPPIPPPPTPPPTPEDEDMYLPEGRYYIGTRGISVTPHRHFVRNAAGETVNMFYTFDITGTETVTTSVRLFYTMLADLTTANSGVWENAHGGYPDPDGSYLYHGRRVQMYHGFTAAEYPDTQPVEVLWASSFQHADPAQKTAVATVTASGNADVAALWEDAAFADSETPISSNILSVRDTGRWLGGKKGIRIAPHLYRRYRIYSLTLRRGTLQSIMKQQAADRYAAQFTADPQQVEATGNSNVPPPIVRCRCNSVTAEPWPGEINAGSPRVVEGILQPTLAADYDAAEDALLVRGSGQWHYSSPASEETPAAAAFVDTYFTLRLPEHSAYL